MFFSPQHLSTVLLKLLDSEEESGQCSAQLEGKGRDSGDPKRRMQIFVQLQLAGEIGKFQQSSLLWVNFCAFFEAFENKKCTGLLFTGGGMHVPQKTLQSAQKKKKNPLGLLQMMMKTKCSSFRSSYKHKIWQQYRVSWWINTTFFFCWEQEN